MIKEWFLIIIIVVQTYSGAVDERTLYTVKKNNLTTCETEAKWTEKAFEPQLGSNFLTRLASSTNAYTYETQLGGELVGFSIGCEQRERREYIPNIYLLQEK